MFAMAIVTGAAAGLASIPHCIGMCGPLAIVASRGKGRGVAYHLGRLTIYGLLGALAGGSGELISNALPARWTSALISWGLAFALAMLAYKIWTAAFGDRTASAARNDSVQLGREPRRPDLATRLLAKLPKHPLVLGLVTGLLPCGALYAAFGLAAASASAAGGALTMLSFGVVSGSGLFVVSQLASTLQSWIDAGRDRKFLSGVLAAALLAGAVVFAIRPIDGLRGGPPSCHKTQPPLSQL